MKDCYDFMMENIEGGLYWAADCMGSEPLDNDGGCSCMSCPSASKCYGLDLEDGDDELPDEIPTARNDIDAWAKIHGGRYNRYAGTSGEKKGQANV